MGGGDGGEVFAAVALATLGVKSCAMPHNRVETTCSLLRFTIFLQLAKLVDSGKLGLGAALVRFQRCARSREGT